jgi:hypothetical protein
LRTIVRDAPDAITRIDKEEKNKDEGNLQSILDFCDLMLVHNKRATIGDVEIKWKRFRRQVNGRGKMSRQNTAISKTRRAKTYALAREDIRYQPASSRES